MPNMSFPSSRINPDPQDDLLAGCLTGFNAWLIEQGYARGTRRMKLKVITKLDLWLGDRDIERAALDERHVACFLEELGANTPNAKVTGHQLLCWLRMNNIIDNDPSDSGTDTDPVMQVVSRYERFLLGDRGLSPITVGHHLTVIQAFLGDRSSGDAVDFGSLTIDDINEFIRRFHEKYSPGRLKVMVSALRGFCRYLFQCGDIDTDIATAIMSVPNWKLSHPTETTCTRTA